MGDTRARRLLRIIERAAYLPALARVLEISAPVPAQGETATAFGRCAAEVSAAIRRSPAHWEFWGKTGDLVDLGLIPPQPVGSPAETPALRPDGRFLHDGSTDSVPARG